MKTVIQVSIKKFSRGVFALVCALSLIFNVNLIAFAQSTNVIEVSDFDTSHYPQVNANLRIRDIHGNFIEDIQTADIQVMENKTIIPVDTLNLVQRGTRFYVAVNEGPTFNNRYSGVSRLEKIKQTLLTWAQSHTTDTPDEFYLLSNVSETHADPISQSDWASAIINYKPDVLNARSSMSSLSRAVDLAISSPSAAEKTPAILFITPMPTYEDFAALKDIFTRVTQLELPVFIWLIGPQDYTGTDNALTLAGYANATKGQFLVFSGSETLPALAGYLDPLGYIYHMTYTSKVKSSGNFTMTVQLHKDDLVLESEPVPFSLNIQAPNPIFLSPPAAITREWTDGNKRDSVLTPTIQSISIMVEFPDGMQRDLTYSRLFVDNKLAAENTAAPFDKFDWNLEGITESGSHDLQVTIEDSVGLKGETIKIPVDITVQPKPQNWLQKVFSEFSVMGGIIAGIILLFIITSAVLLYRKLRINRVVKKSRFKHETDPVTQPVEIEGSEPLAPAKPEVVAEWPRIHGIGLAPARLVYIPGERRLSAPAEIPLSGHETTFGSDRRKAEVVLAHASVSAEHARIFKDVNGDFRVADAGSSAGTWLNYAPVSTHGARLEHGDLVQFGRLAYRFEIHEAAPRRVQVLPYREE